MSNVFWTIIDIQKDEPRFCYADENKTNGLMAVYDKKPSIAKEWKPFKRVVKVSLTINKSKLIYGKDIRRT